MADSIIAWQSPAPHQQICANHLIICFSANYRSNTVKIPPELQSRYPSAPKSISISSAGQRSWSTVYEGPFSVYHSIYGPSPELSMPSEYPSTWPIKAHVQVPSYDLRLDRLWYPAELQALNLQSAPRNPVSHCVYPVRSTFPSSRGPSSIPSTVELHYRSVIPGGFWSFIERKLESPAWQKCAFLEQRESHFLLRLRQ